MSRSEDVWEMFARAHGAEARAAPPEDGAGADAGGDGDGNAGADANADGGERGIATGRSRALTMPERRSAPEPTWHAAFLATLRG